jgi:hypothetical protein
MLPQFLALVLHRDGDPLPASFDILDERAQNTIDRLTVQNRRWEDHPTGRSWLYGAVERARRAGLGRPKAYVVVQPRFFN